MWCRRATSCSSASMCKAAGDQSGAIKLWHHKQQHVDPLQDVRRTACPLGVCLPSEYHATTP